MLGTAYVLKKCLKYATNLTEVSEIILTYKCSNRENHILVIVWR